MLGPGGEPTCEGGVTSQISLSSWRIAKLLCLLDKSKKHVHDLTLIPTLPRDRGLGMGRIPDTGIPCLGSEIYINRPLKIR
jgi:hypothetical protein